LQDQKTNVGSLRGDPILKLDFLLDVDKTRRNLKQQKITSQTLDDIFDLKVTLIILN